MPVLASKAYKVRGMQWSIPPAAREDLLNLICPCLSEESKHPACLCFESGVIHIWTYRYGTVIKETRRPLALNRAQSRINLSRHQRGEWSKSIFDHHNIDNQYAVVQQVSLENPDGRTAVKAISLKSSFHFLHLWMNFTGIQFGLFLYSILKL